MSLQPPEEFYGIQRAAWWAGISLGFLFTTLVAVAVLTGAVGLFIWLATLN